MHLKTDVPYVAELSLIYRALNTNEKVVFNDEAYCNVTEKRKESVVTMETTYFFAEAY